LDGSGLFCGSLSLGRFTSAMASVAYLSGRVNWLRLIFVSASGLTWMTQQNQILIHNLQLQAAQIAPLGLGYICLAHIR